MLHVGGAESVHAVFVNGAFVGYGTDSRLPSEYDITDLTVAGTNHVAIVVVRYSAHSYVEDQDQWWMAGLHRSVFVEARLPVRIADLAVDARPGDDVAGLLHVATTVSFDVAAPRLGGAHEHRDARPVERVGGPASVAVPDRFAEPYVFAGHVARVQLAVAHVERWSAESPTRYRVVVELLAPDRRRGRDRRPTRRASAASRSRRRLLVNGRPIWVLRRQPPRPPPRPRQGRDAPTTCVPTS